MYSECVVKDSYCYLYTGSWDILLLTHRQVNTFIVHLCLSAMGNVDNRDIAKLYDKCVIIIFKTCFARSNKEHKVKQVLSGNWGLNLHMSRLNIAATRALKDLLVSHNEFE